MATNKDINNLVINKVENQQVYDYMVQNNLIKDDELYLIQGELNEYKIKQTAVSSPSASGSSSAFIDSISQDENGKITVTKKNVNFPDYNNTYKKVQTAVSSPAASGNTTAFIDTISQDAQGKITVTKKNVQFPDYSNTYQPKGNYKTVQTAVSDPTASGSASAFIDSISQDTNGKITVTKKSLSLPSILKFIGTTTTSLTDGATTNPITIDEKSITAVSGNVVILSGTDQEFLWTGSAWEEFGNASGHSIKGHTHTITHQPAGSISEVAITPSGSVSQPTFTGTAATSQANSGTNQTVSLNTHKHSVTAAGTVSQPTFTGSSVTSSANSGNIVSSITTSITNRCFTFAINESTHTHTVTAAGTVSQPTFTGSAVTSDAPSSSYGTSVAPGGHTHSVTATGSVSQPTFTGTESKHTHTFTGTSATLTTSGSNS